MKNHANTFKLSQFRFLHVKNVEKLKVGNFFNFSCFRVEKLKPEEVHEQLLNFLNFLNFSATISSANISFDTFFCVAKLKKCTNKFIKPTKQIETENCANNLKLESWKCADDWNLAQLAHLVRRKKFESESSSRNQSFGSKSIDKLEFLRGEVGKVKSIRINLLKLLKLFKLFSVTKLKVVKLKLTEQFPKLFKLFNFLSQINLKLGIGNWKLYRFSPQTKLKLESWVRNYSEPFSMLPANKVEVGKSISAELFQTVCALPRREKSNWILRSCEWEIIAQTFQTHKLPDERRTNLAERISSQLMKTLRLKLSNKFPNLSAQIFVVTQSFLVTEFSVWNLLLARRKLL